jgi:hypothetical protein
MPSPAPTGGSPDRGPTRDRRRLAVVLWIALAALAALAAFKATRRVEQEAAFCASSCHHPGAPVAAHAGGHQGLACQQCHTVKLSTGLALLAQSVAGTEHPRRHGKVDAPTCARCHEARPAGWAMVAATEGHRTHRGVKSVTCVSCHGPTAHHEQPAAKVCLGCHQDQRLHKATTGDAETCLSCHSFAASPERAQQPSTLACARCHASPAAVAGARPTKDVDAHALHGDVACQLCHNAHGKQPRLPEGQPVCARCHQLDIWSAGSFGKKPPEGHRNCQQCHEPHAPKQKALESCVGCHEKNATARGAAGPSTALKHTSCASCHLPHSWRAERSGCVQCHEEKAQKILTRSPPEHGTCTNCHEVHGPPPTGAVCVGCHAKTRGRHVTLAPERHKDCTSCHDPHAPSPKDTRTSCAKCHTTELSGVMRDGPDGHAKDGCFGCHQPHDNPLPAADVCSRCHADKARLVATASPPRHRACTSCHEKHSFTIKDTAAACATCHGPTRTTARAPDAVVLEPGGPHRGDCKHCHTPHGSPGVAQAACLRCHEALVPGWKPPNEKHATCRSCHEPHKAARAAPARCGTCHAAPAAVAAKWPASSAHAQACNGCHQPHDVRTKKACASCHEKEAASAAGGKHRCVQCHAPHQAPPGTGPAWWSRCADCHANKIETAKTRGPVHADCKNCHQPHRFEVPLCTSCHKDTAGKGLHATAQHAAKCSACHDPHVKSEAAPAQCLACHTNRRNHEPTAQKCQACHLFK